MHEPGLNESTPLTNTFNPPPFSLLYRHGVEREREQMCCHMGGPLSSFFIFRFFFSVSLVACPHPRASAVTKAAQQSTP